MNRFCNSLLHRCCWDVLLVKCIIIIVEWPELRLTCTLIVFINCSSPWLWTRKTTSHKTSSNLPFLSLSLHLNDCNDDDDAPRPLLATHSKFCCIRNKFFENLSFCDIFLFLSHHGRRRRTHTLLAFYQSTFEYTELNQENSARRKRGFFRIFRWCTMQKFYIWYRNFGVGWGKNA